MLGMLCWVLTSASEAERGICFPRQRLQRVLSREITFGVVQNDNISEMFGCIVSGTCQGPGLGLGIFILFPFLLFF